jgi:hypothetical protein
MHDIDVHVIRHPLHQRDAGLQRVLMQLADEPVNVHVVDGYPKHIGNGRFDGFSAGSARLCSYVDDDDLIEPGIYAKVLDAFAREPGLAGLCTREVEHHEDGTTTATEFMHPYYNKIHLMHIHHLAVLSRAVITPYLRELQDLPDGSEHTLWARVLRDGGAVRHLPEIGYHWMKHAGNSPALGIVKPPVVREIFAELMRIAQAEGFASNVPGNDPPTGHRVFGGRHRL